MVEYAEQIADAAVATAAALNVTEPSCTGRPPILTAVILQSVDVQVSGETSSVCSTTLKQRPSRASTAQVALPKR